MSDSVSIGVKIHDVHHGLIQSSGAIVESEFAMLKELGVAIQLATTLKIMRPLRTLSLSMPPPES